MMRQANLKKIRTVAVVTTGFYAEVIKTQAIKSGRFIQTDSVTGEDVRTLSLRVDKDYTKTLLNIGDVVTYQKPVGEVSTVSAANRPTSKTYLSNPTPYISTETIYDFRGTTENGDEYVNYLSSDYQAILLGAVQQLIKRVETLEEKVK